MNKTADIQAPMLKAGGALAAINPQNYDEVIRLARMAVLSGLCGSQKDTEDVALAKATMAILHGLECGVPAIQAVQGIAIINGKAMMYGDLLTALLWSKGFKVRKWTEGTGDDKAGCASITRPDGAVIEKRFTVAQAKRAGLWDTREKVRRQRNGGWHDVQNDSPWYCHPERMLEWRAFGFAVKDGASDATHGMVVREEADPDMNRMVDITPPAPSTLEIPDDVPADGPASETQDTSSDASIDEVIDDTPIADPELFIEHLRDSVALCESMTELQEVADANADVIARLPAEYRKRAASLITDRMNE